MPESPLRYLLFFFALGFTLTLSACGDSSTDPLLADSVAVSGPDTMVLGDTATAAALVFDGQGEVMIDHPVTWSSSSESVATISEAGLITAHDLGTTTITATSDGASDDLELVVRENPCAAPVGIIELGQTVEGELTTASCYLESWFHDPWVFELEEATTVQFDLMSEDFDAFVILTDSLGNFLLDDDDSGEGDNARMVAELEPAIYFIWASTYDEDDTGEYELSTTDVEAEPSPPSPSPAATGSVHVSVTGPGHVSVPTPRGLPERRKR